MISKFAGSYQKHFKGLKEKFKDEPRTSSNDDSKDDCENILKPQDLEIVDSYLSQSQIRANCISWTETKTKRNDEFLDMKKDLNSIKTALKQNGIQIL